MLKTLCARAIRALWALPVTVGLGACMPPATEVVVEAPPARVAPPVPAMPAVAEPSSESQSAARYYRRIESRQLAQGLMRVDGGGPDVPFTADDLQRNFERVALFNEYVQIGGRFVAQQSTAQLRRWEDPVRIKLHFGSSMASDVQARDRAVVQRYVDRLRRATGHPISITDSTDRANYHVFVVSIDEQRALGPLIKNVEPKLGRSTIHDMTTLPRTNYCAVYASSTRAKPFTYSSAIAIIRTEHPDLMRDACYHEEIAQGLGLANDSPAARPSIFNDDEEFAFLTTHDEKLLSILYDRRLSPGMTAAQARPILTQLARERAPNGAS